MSATTPAEVGFGTMSAAVGALGGALQNSIPPGTPGRAQLIALHDAISAGMAGNDLLEGNNGNDSLLGGDGNDTLQGG